jgi:hypothetical protein
MRTEGNLVMSLFFPNGSTIVHKKIKELIQKITPSSTNKKDNMKECMNGTSDTILFAVQIFKSIEM